MLRVWPIVLFFLSATAFGGPRLVINTGHTDDVSSVAFSPDGKHVLTGSHDQTARIWDVISGREILRLSDHDDWVTSAVYSPDGRFVATGTLGSTITIFSAESGDLVRKIDGGGRFIVSVAYITDGSRIVSADGNGDLAVWSASNGREIRRFHIDAEISAMAVSPDGNSVSLGTTQGSLYLLSLEDGQQIVEFTGFGGEADPAHSDAVATIAFSTDGSFVISGGLDGHVARWEVADGQHVFDISAELDGYSDPATALAVSPDGRSFLTGHESGYMHLWSAADGKGLAYGHTHEGVRVNSLAFSTDGAHVVSGADQGKARLWRVQDGTEILAFEGLVDSVEAIDVHPDGRSLAAGSGYLDKEVSGWSLQQGVNLGRLAGDSRVRSLQFSPDGSWLAYTFDDSESPISFWNNAAERLIEFSSPFDDEATAVSFSPDGRHLLAYSNGSAQVWDVETRQRTPNYPSFDFPAGGEYIEELQFPDGSTGEIVYELGRTAASWSPDGRHVVMGISDEEGLQDPDSNYAYVWRIDSGKLIKKLGPVERGVNSLQFSPDGRYLLASSDGSATIWDFETGETYRRLDHRGTFLNSAIWMPDGRHIVTGGRDRLLRIWDVVDGREVMRFEGHTGQINDIRLLEGLDGIIIVSASQDGTIRLWDSAGGGEICQLVSFGSDKEGSRGDGVSKHGGEWAVVDSAGRFDASNGGDVEGLHWIVDDEVVALSQLKESFYEPGLLAKVLGFNSEPLRDVDRFSDGGVELHPEVTVSHLPDAADPWLRLTVENRGGGIGPVQVLLNGKEVTADARPAGSNPDADSLKIELDLANHPYMLGGGQDTVSIVASNREQSLVSRGNTLVLDEEGPINPGAPAAPSIWALVVGVSDYQGDAIDLNFAHRDAASFADALDIAARGLVDPDRVHIRLINGDTEPATRSNLQQAFEDIAGQASASDILVLYLAGHGVTWPDSSNADYYYLLQDAKSLEISDGAIRKQVAISSQELTDLIKSVPALKQVLILDTCASGQLVSDLMKSRGMSSGQMRSIERMKDRTGMFILTGSAADAVSYEASPYGQGLLTYSLLAGMRGAALRADEYVDVSTLFSFATDEVPRLADRLGGVQQPRIGIPRGGETFDIGRVSATDRAKIKVASPKPVVISTNFQDEHEIRDHLDFGSRLDAALMEASSGPDPRFAFFATRGFPDAYALAGRYEISGDRISVTVVMAKGGQSPVRFEVTGSTADLPALEAQIVREMESRLK